MSSTSWEHRVTDAMKKIDQRKDGDRLLFEALCKQTHNAQVAREGERLTKFERSATKAYLGADVFHFSVADGVITVRSEGGEPEQFSGMEDALDRMAHLMAVRIMIDTPQRV